MTLTKHGIGQKRSNHNLEAAQSQQQPLLGRAKVALALDHKWEGGVCQVRREGIIWAEEVTYAKGQLVKEPFYMDPDPFRTREVTRPHVSPKAGIPELLVGPITSCFLPHARSANCPIR